MSGAVTSAYNQAPNLGVTSTVQAAYSKATGAQPEETPVVGGQDLTNASTSEQQRSTSSSKANEGGDREPQTGADILEQQHQDRLEESRQAGRE